MFTRWWDRRRRRRRRRDAANLAQATRELSRQAAELRALVDRLKDKHHIGEAAR